VGAVSLALLAEIVGHRQLTIRFEKLDELRMFLRAEPLLQIFLEPIVPVEKLASQRVSLACEGENAGAFVVRRRLPPDEPAFLQLCEQGDDIRSLDIENSTEIGLSQPGIVKYEAQYRQQHRSHLVAAERRGESLLLHTVRAAQVVARKLAENLMLPGLERPLGGVRVVPIVCPFLVLR
jgi:hypothetical protein